MKKWYILFIVGFCSTLSFGQLLVEDFVYTAGTNLTNNGWAAHSGAGTNSITVGTQNLVYSGYGPNGGLSALLDNTGEDVYKSFTSQSSGDLYVSFLLRVDVAANGYFFHLAVDNTTFACRLFLQSTTGGYNLGVGNTTTNLSYGSTVYNTGSTYLVILKYNVSTNGDLALWVKSSGMPADEIAAGTAEVTETGNGQTNISRVALRQYSATQNIVVDGIRVGTSWSYALPVELQSFNAIAKNNSTRLEWVTASEVNNAGFELEKSRNKLNWEKIGFIQGLGNSNTTHKYSFTDTKLNSGNYYYRLKQIDNDGSFEYSKTIETLIENPADFSLGQNYPNPFNPSTRISFSVPSRDFVQLDVYNLTGQKVRTLVNGYLEAGYYIEKFDGTGLASGIYIYQLKAGNGFKQTKQMIFVK